MANPPKTDETKEIIGMTLPGIEDYTNDFVEHSDSHEMHTQEISLSNTGMIRHSFQVLLPIGSPNTSIKLGLPLPPNEHINISNDDNTDYEMEETNYFHSKIQQEDERIDPLLLFQEVQNNVLQQKSKQENGQIDLPNRPNNIHTKQHSVLELDEEYDEDESSESETESESVSDSDDSTKSSSPWGPDSEDFGEGVMTYFVLTQKPDRNETTFVMTPFDRVVEDAASKLKIKYDKITYPTGSKFHSNDLLESEDYHRLQNIHLVKWIKSNSNANPNDIETYIEEKEKNINLTMKAGEDIFCWLKKGINKVYNYYRGKDRHAVKRCFDLIESIFEHFAGDNYKLMLRHEQREDYQLFKLFLMLLHTFARISCRLRSNAVENKFYHYLDHTKKIFKKFRFHLELLKETHRAHIDKKNATRCMQSFVQIYAKNEGAMYSDMPCFELCVKALVALDLYMENYSPLNSSILSDRAAYDINSKDFNWLDGYNKINKYLYEAEEEHEYEYDFVHTKHYDESLKLRIELCSNPQLRIDKLIEKYSQFRGFSFLRARVSWVIGHSKLYHQRKFYESEKYFFEALYCLKTLSMHEFFPLDGTMHTELASLVLIDYADVLLENKKYQYAIVALEKVIDCLQQRGKYERRFQIIRKLCITCTEKEDWNRAIKYHNITLKKLKDNYLNLNEFVYLSQQISTIHLKLNNFNQSEKEIQNGIKTIYLNVLSYHNDSIHGQIDIDNMDNISIQKIFEHCEGEERISIGSLILVLANLYISGGNYLEQAIMLLEYLKKNVFAGHSEARRLLILFQLARAYFKHGKYQSADDIIQQRILANYSSKNKELLSSLEFIQLRVLIMINCQREDKFDAALRLLDETMKLERKESFVKKAKLNYLKGLVLQQRCFDKLIRKYQQQIERVRVDKKRQSRKSAKIVITEPVHNQNDFKHEECKEYKQECDIEDGCIAPPTPDAKPKHRRGGYGGGGGVVDFYDAGASVASLHQKDINPLDAISALLISRVFYKSIEPIMHSKCCLELSKTYLEIMMEYYALPRFVLKDRKCSDVIIQWLGNKIFNDNSRPIDEVIAHCLVDINLPLYTALSLSKSQTKDIGLLIECYIALAEHEFLKGANSKSEQAANTASQTSKNFWQQSKNAFFSTYKDSNDWIFLRRIDTHSRLQIFALFKRILRLLICYDNPFIAENVEIFVSYISLETFMIAQEDIVIMDHKQNKAKHDHNKSSRTQRHNNNLNIPFDNFNKQRIPQNQYQKNIQKNSKKSKSKIKNAHRSDSDFSRYNSTAIYRADSVQKETHRNVYDAHNEEEKDEIIKNPTVTFRIDDEQNEGLSHIQLAADTSVIRPLYQRYANYINVNDEKEKKKNVVGGECDLDELFTMHWKMRTESSQFSGGRSTEIDNDKSLVTITNCISALNVDLDISRTLNRAHRCWKANETFIISLDSIVFIFHPHTLFKHAINKKRNVRPTYKLLKSFANILTNIAFHDSDYLELEDNPWINKQNSNVQLLNEESKENKPNKMKKRLNLCTVKQKSLRNELSLPYLKLESISELLMCLDPQNILNLFSAMFSECQIIIISRERCRCLAIMDALFVLMYPFSWQYPCIPWLSPCCLSLLNLAIPYIFGVASINMMNKIISSNKYDICDRAVIIDADTNNVQLPLNFDMKPNQLPMKIKSKLTRAMFRLISGLLKHAYLHNQINQVFPPRRRDNITNINDNININNNNSKYKLLSSPRTAPISRCSERKKWYDKSANNKSKNNKMREMIIDFQKEFCTSWVEVLEQYRLFWVNINSALHKDLKSKSTIRIQKYAHPRYRKFLTEIQKTRMFSSFQCVRSLASTEMLSQPMFDNLVMQSLKWRQSLYHDIIQQQQQETGRMKVSVENCRKRYFLNHLCTVKFDPVACTLCIQPDINFITKSIKTNHNLLPFEVYLNATVYELESDDVHKLHPYIDPKQVKKYGDSYQFRIKHKKHGTLTLNCKSYYELTRWIHILRAHSMDTWSWCLNSF